MLRVVLPLVAGAVVLAFVIGSVAEIGPSSATYRRTIDRGFAAMAASVAAESNATGSALTSLLGQAPGLERVAFFAGLDHLAADAANEQQQLDSAVPPDPADGSDAGCLSAVSARASAVGGIRQALEGLVGGATGTTLSSPAQAENALDQAAVALAGADGSWASCRHALRSAPGRPRLASSQWIGDPHAWSEFALANLVDAVAGSGTLAARPALSISALVTDPTFLPGPSGPVVSPTRSLSVHAVVSDTGNVEEAHVLVTASLLGGPLGGPKPASVSQTVTVDAGDSVSVVLGSLAVVPGVSYTLEITAVPPSGAGATSTSSPLQVATIPTTTTTTTAPTTTTTTVPKRRGSS